MIFASRGEFLGVLPRNVRGHEQGRILPVLIISNSLVNHAISPLSTRCSNHH